MKINSQQPKLQSSHQSCDHSAQSLEQNIAKVVQELRAKALTIGFAESCTGGLLSSYFTRQAGISDVFMGSVITYSNSLKENLLGVLAKTLQEFGAVSKNTAQEMAEGCLRQLKVNVGVAITGIAGPSGGTATKPVGTVYIAVAGLKIEKSINQSKYLINVVEYHFEGDRQQIQQQACMEALCLLNEFLNIKK